MVISLLTCPRPDGGPHIALIQRNALRSWAALGFGTTYPLRLCVTTPAYGDPRAVWVETDPHGTPLVSSIFGEGERACNTPLLGYINSDIILLDDFMPAVEQCAAMFPGPFLLVGQRIDLDISPPMIGASGWQDRLRAECRQRGQLHQPAGIDYFMFRRGTWGVIPPFALGRLRWDNWLVWDALQRGVPVVDGTALITAIHQNHSRAHQVDGAGAQQQRGNEILFRLSGASIRTIADATHRLTQNGLETR